MNTRSSLPTFLRPMNTILNYFLCKLYRRTCKMLENSFINRKHATDSVNDFSYDPKYQKSILADYCPRAISDGHDRCIWLCRKDGKQYTLIDIPTTTRGQTIGFADIRKRYSWWKRHSLYSAVGVKQVKVSITGNAKKTDSLTRQGPCCPCQRNDRKNLSCGY